MIGEAIKTAVKKSGITQKELAEKLEVKSQSVIAQRFRCDNLSIDKALEMLDVVGYELVIRNKYDKKAEEIVITDK